MKNRKVCDKCGKGAGSGRYLNRHKCTSDNYDENLANALDAMFGVLGRDMEVPKKGARCPVTCDALRLRLFDLCGKAGQHSK